MEVRAPMRIVFPSPRSTAVGQIEVSSPSVTCPITTAEGSMYTRAPSVGWIPRYVEMVMVSEGGSAGGWIMTERSRLVTCCRALSEHPSCPPGLEHALPDPT